MAFCTFSSDIYRYQYYILKLDGLLAFNIFHCTIEYYFEFSL